MTREQADQLAQEFFDKTRERGLPDKAAIVGFLEEVLVLRSAEQTHEELEYVRGQRDQALQLMRDQRLSSLANAEFITRAHALADAAQVVHESLRGDGGFGLTALALALREFRRPSRVTSILPLNRSAP